MEPGTASNAGHQGPRTRTKLVTLVLLLAVAGYAVTRPSTTVSFEATGPALSTPPAGQLTALSADQFEGVLVGLRGKAVIVNVWASWCAPCRTETPLLERAWRANSDHMTILGVASKDVSSGSRAFIKEFGVTFPNIFDGTGEIRSRLGLRGFPATYVFDINGTLRTTIIGGLTEQRLAAVLNDLRS
ncbi:MAG: TlpA disulfide reductase family protein [Ilumatobacteraceae bacterium]